MKPKAKATVVKSVKVDPETLFEIENDPRYTDFSTFTRDALMAYIESRKLVQNVTQGIRLQGQPPKTVSAVRIAALLFIVIAIGLIYKALQP